MHIVPILAAAACAVLLSGLRAAAAEIEPGLWDITTTRERGGAATARPKSTRCITPEMAQRFGPGMFDDLPGDRRPCTASEGQTTADGTQSRVRCVIGNHSVDSIAIFRADSPQHYTVELKSSVTIAGSTTTSTLRTEARRIAECPP